MMRILKVVVLFFSCGFCLAEDFPEDTNEIKSLTAEQAADLALIVKHARKKNVLYLFNLASINKDVAHELAKFKGQLALGLTSINKDVAQELVKFKRFLDLNFLTSIDKDVAHELAKFKGTLNLGGLKSIDKDVAQELAKFKGELRLYGLTSIDEVSLAYLKSNARITLVVPRQPKPKTD